MSLGQQVLLAVRDVSMSFGGVAALDKVSLSLHPGGWLGVIGPNGSGKTTLLNVLSGVYRARAGSIFVDGRDVTRFNPAVRGRMGIVRTFQHPQLAHSLTIEENILLGAERHKKLGREDMRSQVRFAAQQFGCTPHLSSLPDEVPYGIRKLAEVARATLAAPRLLLLDEPAAGLSWSERTELISALKGLKKANPMLGVCLIEHDVSLIAALCEDIVVLHHGSLLAMGPAQNVLANEAVKEAYLGRTGSNVRHANAGHPESIDRLSTAKRRAFGG